jgi:transposase
MGNVRFVGLDVHKESIAVALAESDGSAPQLVGEVPSETAGLVKMLRKLGKGGTIRCCYEAGPTGFGLYRALREAGFDCIVIAPSLVPKQAEAWCFSSKASEAGCERAEPTWRARSTPGSRRDRRKAPGFYRLAPSTLRAREAKSRARRGETPVAR